MVQVSAFGGMLLTVVLIFTSIVNYNEKQREELPLWLRELGWPSYKKSWSLSILLL